MGKRADFTLLGPIAKEWFGLVNKIDNANLEYLRGLRKEIARVTEINCWWATFEIAEILKPRIDDLIARRQADAQAKRAKAPAAPSKRRASAR